jgi:hypothetical protein
MGQFRYEIEHWIQKDPDNVDVMPIDSGHFDRGVIADNVVAAIAQHDREG